VGVDGSPPSDRALVFAADLARLMAGELVALHVATAHSPPAFQASHLALRAETEARARGEAILARSAHIAGDVLVARELQFGDPVAALCRRARELPADLIVVGSRGLGRLGRLLLGSVSASVSERAPCSVLVVRAGEQHPIRSGPR
jgi:nucleotide-binding universal stress UspA family protein